MTGAASVSAQLTNLAREQRRNSHEMHILYALERFLDRLGRTEYAGDFVLKGGLLLAAYRLRRPTRDADLQAMDIQLDEEHLRAVVAAVSAIDDEDGLAIDADATRVVQIRDDAEYTGLPHIGDDPTRCQHRRPDLAESGNGRVSAAARRQPRNARTPDPHSHRRKVRDDLAARHYEHPVA
ncbi:nucleotidyl transferase AbiEii/AbiGii toxin family protein [Diaminobutyricibacter tongyongensis]|uniref:Nucleotidyl transferase AbiEii/AbiGii toxin family protein n=1 Tax=Leifsonia tongyongensis TaxID=1268043 RepID=A0A6L9XT78_9MICO|nr:nucleotidyl transferase AbiEii/AbiGii toxin family protein [Diaminobutyricibacter tongyongensis]